MKVRLDGVQKYFLISILFAVLFNTPFSTDIFLPKVVRFVPLALVIIFYILAVFERTRTMLQFCSISAFFSILMIFWALQGNFIFTNAMLVVFSVMIVFMMRTINLSQSNFEWLYKCWDKFVLLSIFSTIICYVVYNFFGQLGFRRISLGQYSESNTAFNPILGAVSIRNLVIYQIGRVAWFTSEPSYLGYLHGLNFFWLYLRRDKLKKRTISVLFIASLLALIFTFSLGSWFSLMIACVITFFLMSVLFLINYIKANRIIFERILLMFICILILILIFRNPIVNFFEIVNEYYQNIDKYSSLDDRSERISTSFHLWGDINFLQKVFGIGPGSIENLFSRGESNGWIKISIEGGLFFTLAYIMYLCKLLELKFVNIALFLFIVISYNSVIILTAPAVLFYICLIELYLKNRMTTRVAD